MLQSVDKHKGAWIFNMQRLCIASELPDAQGSASQSKFCKIAHFARFAQYKSTHLNEQGEEEAERSFTEPGASKIYLLREILQI
jgi:hypothetical protein